MKSEHQHRILDIRNDLGTKFLLKLTILNFWTKLIQKGYFQTLKEKKSPLNVKFYLFRLV